MDENVNATNNEITLIEHSISKDLREMNQSVAIMRDSLPLLDAKVGNISLDVNRMPGVVGRMGYDIHKGRQSFSSPMGYMMNMFP
jgi:hypothetical protein